MHLTKTQLKLLQELLYWSHKYEISIQFWPDTVAVYIAKDGVDLQSFGSDFDSAVTQSINYLNRLNRK